MPDQVRHDGLTEFMDRCYLMKYKMAKKIGLGRRRRIMEEPKRVTAEEVYGKLKSGKTLLVCAYEDEERFRKLQLEGAISLNAFKSRVASLSRDQEIVFY